MNETKRINSEVVKIFNDFMRSLPRFEDSLRASQRNLARYHILNLIAEEQDTISFYQYENEDGDLDFLTRIDKRFYDTIEYIRDNLDVWDIEDLPPVRTFEKDPDEDKVVYLRTFKFTRRD
jgi:hypothetical protein